MALIIKEKNGEFFVEGVINSTTATNFQFHFEYILKTSESTTINIEGITEIDANGMRAIKAIYFNALMENKPFYIVGNGCKEIYDELLYAAVA